LTSFFLSIQKSFADLSKYTQNNNKKYIQFPVTSTGLIFTPVVCGTDTKL